MLSPELVFAQAVSPSRRIGIGASDDLAKVEGSVRRATEKGYGACFVYRDPRQLVKDLKEGRLDAAVRGSLDSNLVMREVREQFSLSVVERMAFLQPRSGRMFLFGPVGVDEGWTVEQKVDLAVRSAVLLRRLGVEPRVGILSGGRRTDLGRHHVVDGTIRDAAQVAAKCLDHGIMAADREILIEEAARDCDIIIAPDGISGNLIFRTLHFLGEGRAMGAVVLNLGKVFVDTSRAKADYLDSIALASALAGDRDLSPERL